MYKKRKQQKEKHWIPVSAFDSINNYSDWRITEINGMIRIVNKNSMTSFLNSQLLANREMCELYWWGPEAENEAPNIEVDIKLLQVLLSLYE
jgi:hypothetical protein